MLRVSIKDCSCCWKSKHLEKLIFQDLKFNDYTLHVLMCSLTLKRVPMEENLDCLDVSSGNAGKRFETKEHFEAVNRS